jgi:hypothetical protein
MAAARFGVFDLSLARLLDAVDIMAQLGRADVRGLRGSTSGSLNAGLRELRAPLAGGFLVTHSNAPQSTCRLRAGH